MKNELRTSLKSQYKLQKLHGKFYAIQYGSEIVKIRKIHIFPSKKMNYPYLCFETKKFTFLGLVIARQSSDLLTHIAKKTILELKKSLNAEVCAFFELNSVKLIHYKLPLENHQVQLIVFFNWSKEEDTTDILRNLKTIQVKYTEKISSLASVVF